MSSQGQIARYDRQGIEVEDLDSQDSSECMAAALLHLGLFWGCLLSDRLMFAVMRSRDTVITIRPTTYPEVPGFIASISTNRNTMQLIEIPGMLGPKKTPHDFGYEANDSHLIVNDKTQTIKGYDCQGNELFSRPALARGVNGDNILNIAGGDTPPGLYYLGDRYADYLNAGPNPVRNSDYMSYGWFSYDMVELEDQERRRGRAGIMLHGGGSACGWPGAWSPYQALYPTYGCVRMHNRDLLDLVEPLYAKGKVYISVYQEDY